MGRSFKIAVNLNVQMVYLILNGVKIMSHCNQYVQHVFLSAKIKEAFLVKSQLTQELFHAAQFKIVSKSEIAQIHQRLSKKP